MSRPMSIEPSNEVINTCLAKDKKIKMKLMADDDDTMTMEAWCE